MEGNYRREGVLVCRPPRRARMREPLFRVAMIVRANPGVALWRQGTNPGDAEAIAIEPAISPPEHPIKTGQGKDPVERPRPPDSAGHIEVGIRARFERPAGSQHTDVIQYALARNLQRAVGEGGLQIFQREASPRQHLLPEVNPLEAEPAAAVVEDPTLAGWTGLRFGGWGRHKILVPPKTTTGEPSATKAESGFRCKMAASSRP